jgi:SAM-dependent methyltransferase
MVNRAHEQSGYDRRIGRYAGELARALMRVVVLHPGQQVLDVGCGSGAMTQLLAELLGPKSIAAIDPSAEDVELCRARVPGADVRVGVAEQLPFPTDHFDAVISQLVVSHMRNAERGTREMRRVARPGAPVATSVWDFRRGGMTALRVFWEAALTVDPNGATQWDQARTHAYSTPEDLEALWIAAGLQDVSSGEFVVEADYANFEDLWYPLTVPDGAPGRFFVRLDPNRKKAMRTGVWDRLGRPGGAFRLPARASYVLGFDDLPAGAARPHESPTVSGA